MKALKKRLPFLLFNLAFLTFFAYAEKPREADIVILIDTSGTILQYYEDINRRILTEIVNKFIRKGDTVHILSFSADARSEISQKITDEADLSRVVSRFLLLYQLGNYSDFLTGLDFCMQYISALVPERERFLIVISDGIFNPPPSSPYLQYTPDRIKNKMSLVSDAIRKAGWKIYYVKLPYPVDAVIKDIEGGLYENDLSGAQDFQGGTTCEGGGAEQITRNLQSAGSIAPFNGHGQGEPAQNLKENSSDGKTRAAGAGKEQKTGVDTGTNSKKAQTGQPKNETALSDFITKNNYSNKSRLPGGILEKSDITRKLNSAFIDKHALLASTDISGGAVNGFIAGYEDFSDELNRLLKRLFFKDNETANFDVRKKSPFRIDTQEQGSGKGEQPQNKSVLGTSDDHYGADNQGQKFLFDLHGLKIKNTAPSVQDFKGGGSESVRQNTDRGTADTPAKDNLQGREPLLTKTQSKDADTASQEKGSGKAEPVNGGLSDTAGTVHGRNQFYGGLHSSINGQTKDYTLYDDIQAQNPLIGGTDLKPEKASHLTPKTKEYLDISKTFTESAGITASEVSKKQDDTLIIKDDTLILPSITFPASLTAHGRTLSFLITVTNHGAAPLRFKVIGAVLDNGRQIDRLSVKFAETFVGAGTEKPVKIKVTLPEHYKTGQYRVILRPEFADGKKMLPQAAELSLFVMPSFFERLKIRQVLFLVFALFFILIITSVFLFSLIRKKRIGKKPVQKKSLLTDFTVRNTQKEAVIREEVKAVFSSASGSKSVTASASEPIAMRLSKSVTASGLISTDMNDAPLELSGKSAVNEAAQSAYVLNPLKPGTVKLRALSAPYPPGSLKNGGTQVNTANMPQLFKQTDGKPAFFSNTIQKKLPSNTASGMTELYVLHQNKNIGKRNVHFMRPGSTCTVGGGRQDDFLIFLVPFPPRIAEVSYDGARYSLSILKPEYFPYETDKVEDCTGKTVTAVSKKGYHVHFTFREYEDPTAKLNGLLASIKYGSCYPSAIKRF